MKARYAQWGELRSSKKAKGAQSAVRVLCLPGIQKLEDQLLFIEFPRRGPTPEVDELANQISLQLFGVTQQQVELYLDDLWDCNDEEYEQRYLRQQQVSETVDVSDEDKVKVLLRLGLDFQDQRGNPLLCTRLFSRQAEAAAKQMIGKLPDRPSANLDRWADNLAREAEAHMKRQKSRRRI